MATPAVKLDHLTFNYLQENSPAALKDVSVTINRGSFVSIVGHTGSGKSTLVSLIDGLIVPQRGQVTVEDITVDNQAKPTQLAKLRRHVGFVFQFPEQQLFAETVEKDIAFGPTNLGWSPAQVAAAVEHAMQVVNLPATFKGKSPFALSGGQKRRVALAGVLAMKPSILILDEPTAGLDAASAHRLLQNITQLNAQGTTIILITHQMDQVAALADQVIVMNHGRLVKSAHPAEIFADQHFLKENHLLLPDAVAMAEQLRQRGIALQPTLTLEQLADQLAGLLRGTTHE